METVSSMRYPTALTVAGSDSGGGAGIQADLRTFSAFGVYGCSAVTALTAQNPDEVRDVFPATPDFVVAQIEAVTAAFKVRVVKTGMLVNEEIVRKIVPALRAIDASLVIDPVMVSNSGHPLLAPQAMKALKNDLLPIATWITPNIPEAESLAEMKVRSKADMMLAAERCANKWSCGCVLKGGHLDHQRRGDFCEDAVVKGDARFWLRSPVVVDSEAGHGTGCTFSAALAAGIALEFPWREALVSAKGFVYGSLMEAVFPGPEIEAMYPPAKGYLDQVQLKKTGGK